MSIILKSKELEERGGGSYPCLLEEGGNVVAGVEAGELEAVDGGPEIPAGRLSQQF